jgi:site-specific DNA-cytosine methylase
MNKLFMLIPLLLASVGQAGDDWHDKQVGEKRIQEIRARLKAATPWRFVRALRPKWVLVEQPLGGRSIIVQAAQELQRAGYGCAGRIINSEHWVPQRRQRWFLIGRLGVSGMALWNHLYPHGERMEGRESGQGTERAERQQIKPSMFFNGSCSDCMRDGVFARISARKLACVGAGNAVSEPVAEWLGKRIIEAVADGGSEQ